MGWIVRHARALLASITAALAILVIASAVTFLRPKTARPPSGPSYPRIQQAAGIIDLMRDSDPKLRPAVLRAVDGLTLRVDIVDSSPRESSTLRRAPRVEEQLRDFAAPGVDPGLRVFIDAAYPPRESDTEVGRLASSGRRPMADSSS